jgi:hypothetical protein
LQRDVSPQYMSMLKARLLRGRLFTEADDANHPQVTILNESMAKKYFAGEDALGKMIGDGDLSPKSMRQVIGIIQDVREGAPDDPPWPAEYFSIYHSLDPYFAVAMRTGQDENAMLPGLVKTLRSINPNLGVYGESTMTAQLSSSQSALLHRFSAWLVGGFAGVFRQPEDARDRCAYGAGCATEWDSWAHLKRSRMVDRGRDHCRPGMLRCGSASDAKSAVWRACLGFHHVGGGCCGAWCCSVTGQFDSRAKGFFG